MWNRIIADGIIVILAFCAPWWLVLPLACVASFFFPVYWELILVGLIIDCVYGSQYFIITGIAAVVAVISHILRTKLRV